MHLINIQWQYPMANWAKVLWNTFMLINYTMLRKKLGKVEPTDYSKKNFLIVYFSREQ